MRKEPAAHLEAELGMTFVKPDRELMKQLRDNLSTIADFIGKAPLDTPTPQKGFLAKPLTDEQKDVLTKSLGRALHRKGSHSKTSLVWFQ